MRLEKPALHPMVNPALSEIQSAGVKITPEIVIWLQDAALRIRKAAHRPDADLIDFPVPCGGVLLYPLSFGAVEWLKALPIRLQNDTRVLAFACVYSRDYSMLSRITGTVAVTLYVAKWILSLRCSMNALSIVVDKLIGCVDVVEVPDHTGMRKQSEDWQWGAIVKSLCAKYPATTPEYWTWEISREKAYMMINDLQDELPCDLKITDYEVNSTNEFRSIVEALKAGTYGG